MKQLIIYFIAKFLNWFKFKNKLVYGSLLTILVWIQTQLADPAVMQMINETFDDAPGIVIKLIRWLPAIVAGLLGTTTSDIIRRGRPSKTKF